VVVLKVGETSGKPSSFLGITEKDEKRVTSSKSSSFQNHLINAEEKSFDEYVNDVVSRIAEQSKKLGKNVDIRELKIYKGLIAEFLALAVGNSRKFSKQSFLDRRGRHKVYAIIKQIDEQLDLLTQDVLENEKDNIKVLQRLDDIRGLILDMVM
jgi:uncharacterized protein YaaR (DUF327 family)